MATIVAVIGGITALYGVIGVISPETIKPFAGRFRSRHGWYAAIIIRLVLGVILVIAGPSCRPDTLWIGWTVRGIGALAIVVAIVVSLLGEAQSLAMMDWSLSRPSTFWRGIMLITLLIGEFLLYAGA